MTMEIVMQSSRSVFKYLLLIKPVHHFTNSCSLLLCEKSNQLRRIYCTSILISNPVNVAVELMRISKKKENMREKKQNIASNADVKNIYCTFTQIIAPKNAKVEQQTFSKT